MSRPSEAKAARRRRRIANGKRPRKLKQAEHYDRVQFGAMALHKLCNRVAKPLKNGGRKPKQIDKFTDAIARTMGGGE